MKVKIKASGEYSIKFRDQIGPFKWNKTVKSTVNQEFEVADIKLGGQQTLSIPGPADVIIGLEKTTLNGVEVNILKASLIMDNSPWALYSTSIVINAQVDKTPPLRIRINNVRGFTADISLKLGVA